MSIPGSPRVFARNIADGYFPFSRASLKQFTHSELRTIYRNLELVVREYRGLAVPVEETQAIQIKNQVLQRASNALSIIRQHGKKHRIPL